ncbi:MAG: hypothetical protein QOG41_34 [Thermoleophilaceae bacterium]|nr:hypothetical protein [Thermoleophilaceae bacterium]
MIGAVVVLLAMLSLLTWQLVVLKDSRGHIAAQDAKITRLMRGSEPVLREARPAVSDAAALLHAAVPVVRGARPVVEALRSIDGARLSATIGVVGRLATELASGDRLTRTVDQTSALLTALAQDGFTDRVVRAADLIPYIARIQAETLSIQRRSLDVQDTTLATQRRALRVLLRSLVIQREALRHVRSIDRKTGGQVPPTAPVP